MCDILSFYSVLVKILIVILKIIGKILTNSIVNWSEILLSVKIKLYNLINDTELHNCVRMCIFIVK